MRISDIDCPYCGEGQEIVHDDGYGYEEDVKHEQICSDCEKNFVYVTNISFHYEAAKADCLNDKDHNLEPMFRNGRPEWPDAVRCVDCAYESRGKYVDNARPSERGGPLKGADYGG